MNPPNEEGLQNGATWLEHKAHFVSWNSPSHQERRSLVFSRVASCMQLPQFPPHISCLLTTPIKLPWILSAINSSDACVFDVRGCRCWWHIVKSGSVPFLWATVDYHVATPNVVGGVHVVVP